MVKVLDFVQLGGPCGDRTHDTRIKSPVLCLTELTAPMRPPRPLGEEGLRMRRHIDPPRCHTSLREPGAARGVNLDPSPGPAGLRTRRAGANCSELTTPPPAECGDIPLPKDKLRYHRERCRRITSHQVCAFTPWDVAGRRLTVDRFPGGTVLYHLRVMAYPHRSNSKEDTVGALREVGWKRAMTVRGK